MAHWLMKSEPAKYGYADLVRDGKTRWDGVRNHQAAIYLRSMKIGDEAFFYHSVEDLAVIGIMQVVGTHYIDPSDAKGKFPCVDVAPVRRLAVPVTLASMKANPKLADMAMFRQFRLSVSPVTDTEWAEIVGMGGA
ncbi:MAG: EVE domain-containing protein [Alphaproteobacteria bacterium]|nr:EVE domain-containing protein [Alphaproteobacteria bacterium]